MTTQATAATTIRQAAGDKANIPPRRMDFVLLKTPSATGYKDNPFLTTFWTTLSTLFPEGETFS